MNNTGLCFNNGIFCFKLYAVNVNKLNEFLSVKNCKFTIKTTYKDVTLNLDLSSFTDTQKDGFLKEFLSNFQSNIYAENDVSLSEQLVKILTLQKGIISVAESFTGGGISKEITSQSGASNVFYEGIVCYNENSKINRLGVSEQSIDELGAVSSKVAYQMSKGLIMQGNSTIALSTTGLAGPNSDKSGLPVGLCYIGVATEEHTVVHKYNFLGNRQEICRQGVETAIFLAIKALKYGIYNL
ncbi:MAG: CinA family protein [Clostridia bacterium]|nr:CinA family protein [Clostridia bacterium]